MIDKSFSLQVLLAYVTKYYFKLPTSLEREQPAIQAWKHDIFFISGSLFGDGTLLQLLKSWKSPWGHGRERGCSLTCIDGQEWADLDQGPSRPYQAPSGRSTQAGSSPQPLATAGKCLSGSCPTCIDAREWAGPGRGPSRPCPAPSGRSTQAGSSPQPLATARRCLSVSCPSHRLYREFGFTEEINFHRTFCNSKICVVRANFKKKNFS